MKAEIMMDEDQAIHEAALEGDLEKLKAMLDEDPSLVDAEGLWGRTPLHAAAQGGKVQAMRFLLDHGAQVDARDSLHSETPLFPAASDSGYKSWPRDAVDCVRLLLSRGANPNARDTHRSQTAVFEACSLEVLKTLELHGADLDIVSSEDQYVYEYHAYSGCDPRMLTFWLDRGVDVNHQPGFGPPVLEGVVSQLSKDEFAEEKVAQVRQLLEYGADPEVADRLTGYTPLHRAAQNGRLDLVTILLDGGADPNSRTPRGHTALHLAAAEGALDVVNLLIERWGDPDAQDLRGRTALDVTEEPSIQKVLDAVTAKVELPPPTPEELIERLMKVPAMQGERLEPCEDWEIAQVERHFHVILPGSYKKFLRLMGCGPRYFLECDHWDAFYPELLQMGRGEQYTDRRPTLPDNYFVFASRLSVNLFFVADGTDDDPPIYSFDGDTFEKEHDSFWDFFRDMVILNEVYGR